MAKRSLQGLASSGRENSFPSFRPGSSKASLFIDKEKCLERWRTLRGSLRGVYGVYTAVNHEISFAFTFDNSLRSVWFKAGQPQPKSIFIDIDIRSTNWRLTGTGWHFIVSQRSERVPRQGIRQNNPLHFFLWKRKNLSIFRIIRVQGRAGRGEGRLEDDKMKSWEDGKMRKWKDRKIKGIKGFLSFVEGPVDLF